MSTTNGSRFNSSSANSVVSTRERLTPILSVIRKRQDLIRKNIKASSLQKNFDLGPLEEQVLEKLQENTTALTENEDSIKIAFFEANAKRSQEPSDESLPVTVEGDQGQAIHLFSSLHKLDQYSVHSDQCISKSLSSIEEDSRALELPAVRTVWATRKRQQELKVRVKDFIEGRAN